jgi:hypothetical protein
MIPSAPGRVIFAPRERTVRPPAAFPGIRTGLLGPGCSSENNELGYVFSIGAKFVFERFLGEVNTVAGRAAGRPGCASFDFATSQFSPPVESGRLTTDLIFGVSSAIAASF